MATLLASRPTPGAPFTWNGRYVGVPYKGWDEQYTTAQYLVGGKGNLPMGDWTYDLYVSYDTTDHDQTMHHAVLKNRVQALLNAADGGNSHLRWRVQSVWRRQQFEYFPGSAWTT